ncbi:cytochrome b-c1 complex subunit 9 [Erethizon dorsatum]
MAGPTVTSRLYSLLFRRTSTFALTIAVGALFFERAFDQGADAIYEHINDGKLWKHIKHKYETKE